MTKEMKECLCGRMAEKLYVLRSILRLSQADLAGIIGVSRQTIVAVETNKRPISWNTFLSLILFFSRNENTDQLLRLYGIYTDELDAYLAVGKGGAVPSTND